MVPLLLNVPIVPALPTPVKAPPMLPLLLRVPIVPELPTPVLPLITAFVV